MPSRTKRGTVWCGWRDFNYVLISSNTPGRITLRQLKIYSKMCIYLHIQAVKTLHTICHTVSLCIIQQYVIYNYMFRPCKRAIIRLFLEPLTGVYNRSRGGTRSRLTSYFVGLHGFKNLYGRVVCDVKRFWRVNVLYFGCLGEPGQKSVTS
jgi:hypothetical protein